MMLLPLGVFLLLSPLVNTKQQCRLKANNLFSDPTFPTSTSLGNSSFPTSTTGNGNPSGSSANSVPTRPPFNYGVDPVRGVNLGGWLVLEPWITPSIFDNTGDDSIVDEFTLGQKRNDDAMRKILENHWDTWITEDDFRQISEAGLNHVRIPVGYWSVPVTSSDTGGSTDVSPYIPGAWPYLLRGLNWAATHNVHVIVDLHGAPGSQNGYDNSGQRTGDPRWAYNPANVSRTIDTLKVIAREIGGMIDVLELLNESAGFLSTQWLDVTRQFWLDAYAAVREAGGNNFKVMIGDAFMGVGNWQNFMKPPSAEGVLMDFHQYQIFSNQELARSFDEHISHTCSMKSTQVNYATNNIWTVMGEWSNAVTDCAKYLNGRGVGIRWEGTRQQDDMHRFGSCDNFTGSYKGFSDDYKAFMRRYFEAQVDIGEAVQGWVYWTWKARLTLISRLLPHFDDYLFVQAEIADDWSYQIGLEGGWIPKNPSDRLYPNICS
ncbi:glycoside hydrolase family 5 protein [Marasmius fiardii PR-910]|nr:glycoside hydrolase family 5 protein [Marasmius fiardii PR-910]